MFLSHFTLFALNFAPTPIKALPKSMPILSCHSGHIANFKNMFCRPTSLYQELSRSPKASSCPWCDPLQAAQSNCGTFLRIFKPTILYQESLQPFRAAHQARNTRKLKNYPCPLCDKLFSNIRHMRSHFRTHSGEKPFPLFWWLWKKISARRGLKEKCIHASLRPYKCEIYNKAFKRNSYLNNHKNTPLPSQAARQARPTKYPCPFCNKLFSNNRQLQCPVQIHRGEAIPM